jgi:hypothetical protein
MIEFIIFIIIFVAVSIFAVISSIGWLKADQRADDLDDYIFHLIEQNDNLEAKVSDLKALLNFYTNRLEEKLEEKK